MPLVPQPRSAHEVASQYGVSLADLRGTGKTKDTRLTEARKAYQAGLKDGSVDDGVEK